MGKNNTFAERRRQLQAETRQTTGDGPVAPEGEAMDDWNNFPNYFKFGSFANTSVPDTKVESKSPVK